MTVLVQLWGGTGMLRGKPGSSGTSMPQRQPSLTHPEPPAKPLPCITEQLDPPPEGGNSPKQQSPECWWGQRGVVWCWGAASSPGPLCQGAGAPYGYPVPPVPSCVWQGGAGARGERVQMETCCPPAGDLLHKQEICQSSKKCEGRSRQHVVWAGGTSPPGRAVVWLQGHSLSLDPIDPCGWQGEGCCS